jgi:hypothetical protein
MGSLSGAHAQNDWQLAAPFPQPVGEIVGAVVDSNWYVLAGLDMTGFP